MKFNKVSIIVPVYKAEKSIKRCIESILSQTYKNVELILVDDGSPDKSGSICDKYKKDTRVKVIHTSNAGVSHARNIGIDYATGNYVTFCDSDDFYEVHCIERMMRIATECNSDITICGYFFEWKHHFESAVKSKTGMIDKNEMVEHCTLDNEFGGFCWNKLYKTEIIGENRFPEDMDIMEDTYFLWTVSQKAHRICYLAEPLYYYCDNKNSSVRNIDNLYSNDNTVKYIDAYKIILADFQINKICKNYIYVSMVKCAIDFKRLEKQKNKGNKKLISNLNEIILNHIRDFYACKKITNYEKTKWTIKCLFPRLNKF